MVALPTGPENALALLALAAYHTCAPVNANATATEILEDARRLNIKAIVTTPDAEGRLELHQLQQALNCEVIFITPRRSGVAGLFDMQLMGGITPEYSPERAALHRLGDTSLILHTSGTSGTKKVVPYSLKSLIVGTCCVIQSWDLRSSDVNMNMMPLFHVGGIVRNLLAPILSGGSAIMCFNFDPIAFWSLAPLLRATWYYAAPTIHHSILTAKPAISFDDIRIRMICNAAGGLLPSLALEMKQVFRQAVILPSYGMTECMPIATPPTNYQLDRPGCSGIACGPYLSIRNPVDLEKELPAGATGAICVRGLPTFEGYEVSPDPSVPLSTSAFSSEGWFDSGDVGYMDRDGYLYVTGRSKEIINRGGEVISPFEIEEAIATSCKTHVKNVLAFAVSHDVLQETIGVVIVPADGQPRISLHQLNDLLQHKLHPSKWPFVVVYMNDVPKNNAGKPLRIKLATRLSLPTFTDKITMLQRHFEATLTSATSSLSDPILCSQVKVHIPTIENALLQIPRIRQAAVQARGNTSIDAYVSLDPSDMSTLSLDDVKTRLATLIHGYSIPDAIFSVFCPLYRKPSGDVDFKRIEEEVARRNASNMTATEVMVRDIIAQMLLLEPGAITKDSDFFLLGGNSLLTGKLSHQIRKQTTISLAATDLFSNSTVAGIASLIDQGEKEPPKTLKSKQSTLSNMSFVSEKDKYRLSTLSAMTAVHELNLPVLDEDQTETYPPRRRGQNHPLCLIFQAIPFTFFYPLKTALAWTMLLFVLAHLARYLHTTYWTRMVGLVSAIIIARLTTRVVCPLFAIIFKWIVIGKYQPGVYRTWSTYYLRWWIVNQSLRAAGRGVFAMHPKLLVLYYRLLGAKIGKDVQIDPSAQLGECDLLTLQDGCRIDAAVVRGFCVERDRFIRLDRIVIGARAVLNTYTTIAPGAILPDGAVYGPHASSHDLPSPRSYAAYNRTTFAKPHWLLQVLFAYPIFAIVIFISYIPWFFFIWLMIQETIVDNSDSNSAVDSVIKWFSDPTRVLYHFCARMVHVVLRPLIHVFVSILVKRMLGLNKECKAKDTTQLMLFRRYVNSVLLSKRALKNAFSILGTHYETVSIIYRLMGAKIGRRIYWPGSGIYCLDPELLEIGNDVVFGSRSELYTTDSLGSAKIVIGDGAMIADRVVLLPGTRVGRRTVMGSGALGKGGKEAYEDGSIWMGNGMGNAIRLSHGSKLDMSASTTPSTSTRTLNTGTEDLTTPFGRAFYKRQAPYFVYPYWLIVVINVLCAILTAAYWSVAAVAAAQFLRLIVDNVPDARLFRKSWYRFGLLYGMVALSFVVILKIQAILSLLWVIATKWIIIGRRQEGQFDWDKSSYCQRWQLHLVLSRVVFKGYGNGGVLASFTGSAYFVWYLRALGAKIGKDCGIYVGGRMGLMTEPDLVELGDEVNLDNCSVVAHINSRGHFSLNSLKIAEGCALRTGSRLLSGASMERQSMLCEHTLLSSGEVAEEGATYAGWPGKKLDPAKAAGGGGGAGSASVDSFVENHAAVFMCHMCRQMPKDAVVTDCGHLFCETRLLLSPELTPTVARPVVGTIPKYKCSV
ncbi:AMP-dependent synthetase and ligase [Coprinopsis cinerea okayama7|uniref:AMP-dependent synthetase and ligase n=1 Tax=Coprinopsis cinerea (strain Okayama-7 / 130 / ATCC MYA-4618 / FGSC 9003) TaxID=240176 RepID=A8N8L6_COPC7|nr:AMP-dependent synthetase and ligase [Coprinopsis cinerea okayama7\|eukprot:XP_001831172.2 AMP-dependent synthetase and ligase [Coprinopsis cinerea okayama7\